MEAAQKNVPPGYFPSVYFLFGSIGPTQGVETYVLYGFNRPLPRR